MYSLLLIIFVKPFMHILYRFSIFKIVDDYSPLLTRFVNPLYLSSIAFLFIKLWIISYHLFIYSHQYPGPSICQISISHPIHNTRGPHDKDAQPNPPTPSFPQNHPIQQINQQVPCIHNHSLLNIQLANYS